MAEQAKESEKKLILPEQKKLIQASFRQLLPTAQVAAELFYKRLFELDPSLQAIFKDNLAEQEHKFMSTLQLIVFGLDYPKQLIPTIEQLGERHYNYGVKPEHYKVFGQALIWLIEQGLEENFTSEIRLAWIELLDFLFQIMIEATANLDIEVYVEECVTLNAVKGLDLDTKDYTTFSNPDSSLRSRPFEV